MALIRQARAVVGSHQLCINCLGRLFAGLSKCLTNRERGQALITALGMILSAEVLEKDRFDLQLASSLIKRYGAEGLKEFILDHGFEVKALKNRSGCEICSDIFSRLNGCVDVIVEAVRGYEFESYLIGVSAPARVEMMEDQIRMRYGLKYAENIRGELSREIGKLLNERLSDKRFSLKPDLTIQINPFSGQLRIISKPLALRGEVVIHDSRLKIFSKVCNRCKGKGCPSCNYLGRIGGNSVEYVLGTEVLRQLEASKWRLGVNKEGDGKVTLRMSFCNSKRRGLDVERLKERVNEKAGGLFYLEKLFLEGKK